MILFEIERSHQQHKRRSNGLPYAVNIAAARCRSRNLDAPAARLALTKNDTAKAINYLLNRWAAFTRFLDDGRVCLSNNAAERALRGVAVGRKNWTFAGSDAGGHRAAAVYTLVETCKMNDVDPQAWLADVLARLPDHPANKVADLLPWNWKTTQQPNIAAAPKRALTPSIATAGVLAGCVLAGRDVVPFDAVLLLPGQDGV